MNLLFDTNIALFIVRDKSDNHNFTRFLNPENKSVFISIVSVAELYSIAFQNQWKRQKLDRLESFLNSVQIVMVDDFLTDAYRQIDAFSQRKHPEIHNYTFSTPRNMGKNDLWIAATASILHLRLITTDVDFNHLDGHFISILQLDTDLIRSILNNP